ncbi:MAG: hypothetical protein IJT83_08670, partial [Victivallales bacterium]|nr:hypothetical protein [Victivallales bacterium]
MPLAGIPFWCRQDGIGAFLRVMNLRRLPVGEEKGVVVAQFPELRGFEEFAAIHRPDDIGVQQTARHLAL